MAHEFNEQLPIGTYTVSELGAELNEFLGQGFAGIWVAGELQRPQRSRNGHLYFQLVEKGRDDTIVGALGAVLFRADLLRVERALRRAGVDLQEGVRLRCFGKIDFFAPAGRLQFLARDIDPVFALGDLERRRQETLHGLRELGLLDRNAGLALPAVPLRIGLVTSLGSAAYHDFVVSLGASAWAFELHVVDAAVQGSSAELDLAESIALLDRCCARGTELDVYVLIRGGGSRSDLAAFDSRRVAEGIARAARPVLTGLGHETDETVADRVAHSRFKTPTGVAEFLVQRVADSARRADELARRLAGSARARLARAEWRVRGAEQGARRAGGRQLAGIARRLGETRRELERAARASLSVRRHEIVRVEQGLLPLSRRRFAHFRSGCAAIKKALPKAARHLIAARSAQLNALDRLVFALSPERVLERGYSLTLDGAGRLLRSVAAVGPGMQLATRLRDGTIISTVERSSEERQSGSPAALPAGRNETADRGGHSLDNPGGRLAEGQARLWRPDRQEDEE